MSGDADDNDGADPGLVQKFLDSGRLDPAAVPIASLSMLWYLEPDGRDGVLTKFDGQLRVSVTVGDLTALIHQYLHADEDDE